MRVLLIFGTRPEAIKLAPVIMELKKYPGIFEPVVCSTGQHREMLDQVLSLFQIEPDVDLNLMVHDQSLASLSSLALEKTTKIIVEENPDLILVQGDTTTAMISSLAGFYQKIPIGHVEAGLRTHKKYSPFPEEINRRLISEIATYNFAPTQSAVDTLKSEGFTEESIILTGNTVVDALLYITSQEFTPEISVSLNGKRLILVTAHRRENFGEPFLNICHAIKQLSERNRDIEIIYPVHLNPNVQKPVYDLLSETDRIHLIDPVGYESLAWLIKHSYLVLTDSGGIQEEAPALGKPVLVLRNDTERPEAVEAGVAKMVGTDTDNIIEQTEMLLQQEVEYKKMAKAISPYGDGTAAKQIVEFLVNKKSIIVT